MNETLGLRQNRSIQLIIKNKNMKKVMMAVAVCLTITACEKAIMPESVNESEWGG